MAGNIENIWLEWKLVHTTSTYSGKAMFWQLRNFLIFLFEVALIIELRYVQATADYNHNQEIFQKSCNKNNKTMKTSNAFLEEEWKMSELRLEDMPDEILMKVLSNLDIYGNMDCQVFKKEN